ncbi:Helix-turn-helix domain-containing protein, partial [Segatella baroniae B14]
MYKQLNSEQRYTIFILLQNGMNKKQFATAIKVSPSTISRELKRKSNGLPSRFQDILLNMRYLSLMKAFTVSFGMTNGMV